VREAVDSSCGRPKELPGAKTLAGCIIDRTVRFRATFSITDAVTGVVNSEAQLDFPGWAAMEAPDRVGLCVWSAMDENEGSIGLDR